MSTQIDLEKLRSKLPRGYGKKLSRLTNKSESAVYQALTGKIDSLIIINEAVKMAKEHSQKNNDLANQINNL